MKKILSIILLVSLLLTSTTSIFAKSTNISYEKKCDDLVFKHMQNILNKNISTFSNNQLTLSEKNYPLINNELEKAGLKIYNVNKNNYSELQKKLKMNFNTLFETETPEHFTIIVSETQQLSKQNNRIPLVSDDTYTFETYPWQFRTIYLYAENDPRMAKTHTENMYKKYTGFPYYKSMADILNKTFNIVVGSVTKHSWKILTALGIDLNSIGTSKSSSYYITLNCCWTRKIKQVYNIYDEAWDNSSSADYALWNQYDDCNYYDKNSNKMVRKTYTESGRVNSPHFGDIDWLEQEAKRGFWQSHIKRDVTGDITSKYNDKVVIRFRADF